LLAGLRCLAGGGTGGRDERGLQPAGGVQMVAGPDHPDGGRGGLPVLTAQIVAYLVAHGATTKDEMSAALKNVRVIQTVLGPIGFDQNRDVKSSPVILSIVKDGFAYFH